MFGMHYDTLDAMDQFKRALVVADRLGRLAPAAIEELEKEGEVLVTRTQKDGQLRMVFWNEVKPTEDAGGKRVDQGALR